MKKSGFQTILCLCVLTAFLITACEGPAGPAGEKGSSIEWKGTYANEAELLAAMEAEEPKDGWAYYNTTENKALIYNSKLDPAWQTLAVQGEKGDKGDTGIPGTNAYLVIFTANGGIFPDGSSAHLVAVAGGAIDEPETEPINSDIGVFFNGWYKDEACENSWSFAEDTVTGSTTIYAKWTSVIDAMVMVDIQPGTFIMGSPAAEVGRDRNWTEQQDRTRAGTGTPITITISKGFKMGAHEVTQGLWKAVMGTSLEDQQISSGYYGVGADYPMYYVSWFEALAFCNKLSIWSGLTPVYAYDGKTDPAEWGALPGTNPTAKPWMPKLTRNYDADGYRLPTEAEWEYACRAGTTGPFNWKDSSGNWGSSDVDLSKANLNMGNSYGTSPMQDGSLTQTVRVGSYEPNAWGLYDMHGNIAEMCWDMQSSRSDMEPFVSLPVADPEQSYKRLAEMTDNWGTLGGYYNGGMMIRGGFFNSYAAKCRSAWRGETIFPNLWNPAFYVGFRVVRGLDAE